MEKFSGAGVLIFHNIDNIDYVILGRNTWTKKFGDFGGYIDKEDKTIKQTAIRELYEETNKKIKLTNSKLQNYIDIRNTPESKIYRCYLIKIKNKSKMNMDNFLNTEIDKFIYIPLNKIIKTQISDRLKKILIIYI
jgi:8-oxo-dGTP pyrophosphatase MutT (NUDIX family)